MTRLLLSVMFVVGILFSAGCIGPPQLEKLETIKSNETAFMVNLEGDTKTNQDMFKSVEFLETKKVPSKQVSLNQRKKNTGRMWWQYEWIPTQKVFKVNREPVSRAWTSGTDTGSTNTDMAIYVEDSSGIGFGIGVNVTCSIQEADTATYLYNYAEKPLTEILDNNVRGFVQSILSRECADKTLQECITSKRIVTDILMKETSEKFKEKGITVEYLGIAEGLMFENPEIQKSIDKRYQAEVDIKTAEQEKLAQDKRNEMTVSVAKAEREAAEEFAKAMEASTKKLVLEAAVEAAGKWDGKLPVYLIAGSDSMDKLNMFLPSPVNPQ